jgi:cation transport regulator ChaB
MRQTFKKIAKLIGVYILIVAVKNFLYKNIKKLGNFNKRKLRKFKRLFKIEANNPGLAFVILTVKKPEYMQLAVNNVNSLHYLNPNHKIKIWCDDICYKYYQKNKWRVDYPARVEVINKFTNQNKAWQEFKIETIIESSLNDYVLIDADVIWHDKPVTDRDKIMFQVKAYNFSDNNAEKIMIENLFNKTWTKFNHYVTGFNSIPSKFMTNELQSDLKNIYNKIFNSPLDFIKDENKRNEVKRISEEIAVNLAVQKHYSPEKIIPLKKTDTTKDNFSMQQLYYGCKTRNLE